MEPTKLFRSSGCLVVAGSLLLAASLCAMAVVLLVGVVGPGATRNAASRHESGATAKAVAGLKEIPGVSGALVRELEATGKVSEEALSALPLEGRQRARAVLIDHYGQRASGGVATGVTAGIATLFVVIALAFGIPGSIVGLLLLRRKKVWRCGGCGFAFERS